MQQQKKNNLMGFDTIEINLDGTIISVLVQHLCALYGIKNW